jgi:DNA-binding CsgD family transcriptional regulator
MSHFGCSAHTLCRGYDPDRSPSPPRSRVTTTGRFVVPRANVRQPRLVGRMAECAALGRVVIGARRARRVVVVEGEAGIGKTRMIEAAIDLARDAGLDVLSSRAEELEARWPFSAIADLVGWDVLGQHHLDVGDLRPDAGSERAFWVAERLLERLETRCAGGPMMVAIEDLQWADPATLAVLGRVAAGIERLPVALVVSERPEPRRPELHQLLRVLAALDATWIRLGPLDDTSTEELVENLLGSHPGRRLVGQVRRAGGNPLFVCELVGALLADDAIAVGEGGAELAADTGQTSLSLTILHRLSFLPPEVVDVLGLASVLGATFGTSDLALLAARPLSELLPVLRSAQRAGVLGERGERLAFRHELVRDALYDDMPLAVRRSLHGELARALAEAGEPVERRVEHLVRAATPGDDRAFESLVGAARELVERAPAAAVDVYRRAIELSAVPQARRRELLPELADALVSAGLLDEGEAVGREALAGDLDAEWSGRLRLRLALLWVQRGRPAQGLVEGEAGLAAPEIAGRDRVRLEALVAMARVLSGQVEAAVREAHAVLESTDEEFSRAVCTSTLAMAAAGRGAFAEAAELVAPNVRWAERTGAGSAWDTRPHLILGPALISMDQLDEAYAMVQRGRRGAEALGMADEFGYHLQAGFIDFLRGRLDDALAELTTGAQLAEQTNDGWRSSVESVRALVALHRDDLRAAERHVAAAEAGASVAPAYGLELLVLARTRVLDVSGAAAPALDALLDAFDRLANSGAATYLPLLGPDLARLAGFADRPARAAAVVAELRRIADLNPGVRGLEASAVQTDGLLRSDADALLTAVGLLRGTGRVLQTARAAEDAATAGAPAGELLDEAREIYIGCGASRDLARVEAAMRRFGVRRAVSGPRQRPASGWEALTTTEINIVRLVAERLTNPEIADRLFISRRTVQTHVSHILAKLGVATRRELATEAARRAGWKLRVEGVGEHASPGQPAV